jgi:phage N-6-adenine-methyltransferase
MTIAAAGARLQGSSGNDEIQTPQWLYERLYRAFAFDYDAFASHENTKCRYLYSTIGGTFSRELYDDEPRLKDGFDGFQFPWIGRRVWANPPYSMFMEAVAKFEAEVERAAWIAMLVKVDTSTRWYQRLEECAIVQPLKRRVKFTHPNPPPGWSGASFASAIAFPRRDWVAL